MTRKCIMKLHLLKKSLIITKGDIFYENASLAKPFDAILMLLIGSLLPIRSTHITPLLL